VRACGLRPWRTLHGDCIARVTGKSNVSTHSSDLARQGPAQHAVGLKHHNRLRPRKLSSGTIECDPDKSYGASNAGTPDISHIRFASERDDRQHAGSSAFASRVCASAEPWNPVRILLSTTKALSFSILTCLLIISKLPTHCAKTKGGVPPPLMLATVQR